MAPIIARSGYLMKRCFMSLRFLALCFAANDPLRLARFWGAAAHGRSGAAGGTQDEDEPTALRRGRHPCRSERGVAQLVSLGASRLDTGGAGVGRVMLADPDGKRVLCAEFRVTRIA